MYCCTSPDIFVNLDLSTINLGGRPTRTEDIKILFEGSYILFSCIPLSLAIARGSLHILLASTRNYCMKILNSRNIYFLI